MYSRSTKELCNFAETSLLWKYMSLTYLLMSLMAHMLQQGNSAVFFVVPWQVEGRGRKNCVTLWRYDCYSACTLSHWQLRALAKPKFWLWVNALIFCQTDTGVSDIIKTCSLVFWHMGVVLARGHRGKHSFITSPSPWRKSSTSVLACWQQRDVAQKVPVVCTIVG